MTVLFTGSYLLWVEFYSHLVEKANWENLLVGS